MTNQWIEHVKKVAAEKGISYREALKVASSSYSKKGAPSKTHPGEMDYTTKKGDVVFHEKGKYVKKARKPYTTGGAVKPFLAGGGEFPYTPIEDLPKLAAKKIDARLKKVPAQGKRKPVMDNLFTMVVKSGFLEAVGKEAAVRMAVGAANAGLAAAGLSNPVTAIAVEAVVPPLVDAAWDWSKAQIKKNKVKGSGMGLSGFVDEVRANMTTVLGAGMCGGGRKDGEATKIAKKVAEQLKRNDKVQKNKKDNHKIFNVFKQKAKQERWQNFIQEQKVQQTKNGAVVSIKAFFRAKGWLNPTSEAAIDFIVPLLVDGGKLLFDIWKENKSKGRSKGRGTMSGGEDFPYTELPEFADEVEAELNALGY